VEVTGAGTSFDGTNGQVLESGSGLSRLTALRVLDSLAVASIRFMDTPNLAMDPICDYKKRS
jgi:hypothetical protein